MLEQAAGISIYKTRKKEAKLKLDATEQDLARIEDLLFEINNQLKMLESQAKKAEKYFEIKKEYKISSVELAKAALEGFNSTYKELNRTTVCRNRPQAPTGSTDRPGRSCTGTGKSCRFIEKERELQSLQHAFNELLNNLTDTRKRKEPCFAAFTIPGRKAKDPAGIPAKS